MNEGQEPQIMLDWALRYARKGMPVFAISPDGATKLDATPGADPCGTTDPETIREMWTLWPDANIALATGRATGYIVAEFASAMERRIAEVLLPPTAVYTGPGDHTFYLYQLTAGDEPHPTIEIGDAIMHGDGDFVLLPPSQVERSPIVADD